MFKKLSAITLSLIFCVNAYCMEIHRTTETKDVNCTLHSLKASYIIKHTLESSAKGSTEKPKNQNPYLLLPEDIMYEIIGKLVRGCKDTKDICRNLYRFGLTCKYVQDFIAGKNVDQTKSTKLKKFIFFEIQRLLDAFLKPKYAEIQFEPENSEQPKMENYIKMGLIATLIEAQKLYINGKSSYGFTALMRAAKFRQDETVQLLLDIPWIDMQVQNNFGFTALAIAKCQGFQEIVDLIENHSENQKELEKTKLKSNK